MRLAEIRKALTAAIGAGIAAAVVAMPNGFTADEIGTIVGAIVVAGLAVFSVPNAPTLEPTPLDEAPGEDVSPDDEPADTEPQS